MTCVHTEDVAMLFFSRFFLGFDRTLLTASRPSVAVLLRERRRHSLSKVFNLGYQGRISMGSFCVEISQCIQGICTGGALDEIAASRV